MNKLMIRTRIKEVVSSSWSECSSFNSNRRLYTIIVVIKFFKIIKVNDIHYEFEINSNYNLLCWRSNSKKSFPFSSDDRGRMCISLWSSVYLKIPEEGCQQSFLSLLRERVLCALHLYRSLDSKGTSLHNWEESVTNPKQDIVIKMNTETDEVHADTGFKGEQSLQ